MVKRVSIYQSILQFGNQGPITIAQSKEERDSKAAKTYLGNVKVVWTNGQNVAAAPRDGEPINIAPSKSFVAQPDDLPF
jgi:carbonic anhydrase